MKQWQRYRDPAWAPAAPCPSSEPDPVLAALNRLTPALSSGLIETLEDHGRLLEMLLAGREQEVTAELEARAVIRTNHTDERS